MNVTLDMEGSFRTKKDERARFFEFKDRYLIQKPTVYELALEERFVLAASECKMDARDILLQCKGRMEE